ncbi:aspartate/glutamate racemase family protein [Oricola thermophila]|uniref:Uncharacterized protein n=1 Tax=Oricola thermophila TaxID=2742145 RepID=A0A6N1VGI6_9HYPH|nr:aspartate/glutamate racemase family protein [Oricola thermophila]QKV18259.1 hypothetical protein HTY61_07210 [Oricola thermophila]
MYPSPIVGTAAHDDMFADMAREHKLACTEVHVTSLFETEGRIVGRHKWVNQMHFTVCEHGLEHRLPGFYHVELGVTEFQQDYTETDCRLLETGPKAVEDDFAEALIFGCTMEVGFYRDVERRLGVPVIAPSIAALKRIEYGAIFKRQCAWKPSRMWSCVSPSEEEIAGIGASTTAKFSAIASSSRPKRRDLHAGWRDQQQ